MAAVASAVATTLGFPDSGRVDSTTSGRRARGPPGCAVASRADTTQDADGQFIQLVRRSDTGPVRGLVVAWGKLYPQFGAVTA